jgi:hypothetical protein
MFTFEEWPQDRQVTVFSGGAGAVIKRGQILKDSYEGLTAA